MLFFHTMEKAMATPSSVLAWRIPGTEESDHLAVRFRKANHAGFLNHERKAFNFQSIL